MVKLQPFSGLKCKSLFSLCTVETSLLKTFYSFGLKLSINYKRGNGMGQGEGDLFFLFVYFTGSKIESTAATKS